MTIKEVESYLVINWKLDDPKAFMLWQDRLSHLRSSMMYRIIENSHEKPLKNLEILLSSKNTCTAILKMY